MTVANHIIGGDEATVSQICMVVPNIEEAVAAQLAIADSGPFSVWTYPEGFFKRLRYRGADSPFTLRIALNESAPQIEFVEPLEGPSVFHEHVEEVGYGLHHFAYKVVDIVPVRERMEAAGFEAVQETSGWGVDDDGFALHFDTREAYGCWTEVTQPARERRAPDSVETLGAEASR